MEKVIMICGKICCGKSTYAEQIRTGYKSGGCTPVLQTGYKNGRCTPSAVILSVDEIMLALFGQHAGDKHDEYARKVQKFLFDKSLEFLETGIDVILDWGFWTKDSRKSAKEFYEIRNIKCEFHYIDISDEVWKQRLNHRNSLVSTGDINAYFVDENLAKKFDSIFEMPDREEIDVWVKE